jgi:hypothetical protein
MVGEKSTMFEQFKKLAPSYGDEENYAIGLLRFLPKPIKEADVWFDRATEIWRYRFGLPYDWLPDNTIIDGTNTNLPVSELYEALRIADKRFNRAQLIRFRERLSDVDKHQDVILEMRPLKDLGQGFEVEYEVPGAGPKTIDWRVRRKALNIVLDVKNRTIMSLIKHMKQVIPDLNKGEKGFSVVAPEPADLFKDTEEKFKESPPLKQLQGVWIRTMIQEDRKRLARYFRRELSRRKVHFVILADWKDDAHILARNPIITIVLRKVFKLKASKRFVTDEYPPTSSEQIE